MKNVKILGNLSCVALSLGLLLTACRPAYEVRSVEGTRLSVDSTLDVYPDAEALALLTPYKEAIDSVMYTPLGVLTESIDRFRPESPLSNLVADVLLDAAERKTGRVADVSLMNVGGIRSSLAAGVITVGNVYEILPFENSLCVLTMKGTLLMQLFEEIAAWGGNGIAGARLVISEKGKLLEATVGGKPVDPNRDYVVSTIDYLAEGNDGMKALMQAEKRICPEGATIRSLFREYVERETAADRAISARVEGRIVVR